VHYERISWRVTAGGVSAFLMNEAKIDLSAQDSSQEVAEDAADDRLLTRRLPPMTPPPPRVTSVPPSSPPPAFAPSGTYPANATGGPQPRPSWLHALLTATFPPPAAAAPTDEGVMKRRIGATCAGMALGFVILALALGLRGVEPAYTPAVSAALVIARAMIALGFLGFGYGLLGMAERLLTSGTETSKPPSDLG
jgi:hypothetical protein